jgi:hypothetical protein
MRRRIYYAYFVIELLLFVIVSFFFAVKNSILFLYTVLVSGSLSLCSHSIDNYKVDNNEKNYSL